MSRREGGDGQDVFCCHTSVSGKHWVYPVASDEGFTRPIEFAFGELGISAGEMGCDLRRIDPAHPQAGSVPVCGTHGDEAAASGNGATRTTYYDPKDLAKFGDVGASATGTTDKFWAYYTAATGTDGALTKREKSLIGLAVAHARQCPYCIDAYTAQCLDTGSNAEEMHEAVHVAAALSAGIELVHGVQMRNARAAYAT